jgi:hypothetical protein
LNLRLHPYQQNAGNRCAKRRSRRSRTTVEVEVMCSHRVQLCALIVRLGLTAEDRHPTDSRPPPPTRSSEEPHNSCSGTRFGQQAPLTRTSVSDGRPVAGLGGLEPPASSLSAIEGSALCGPGVSPGVSPVDAEAMGSNGVDLGFSRATQVRRRAAIASAVSQTVRTHGQVNLRLCGFSVESTYSPDWQN